VPGDLGKVRIPSILHTVVCSSRKKPRDQSPLVPMSGLGLDNEAILLCCPCSLGNFRIQVVCPPAGSQNNIHAMLCAWVQYPSPLTALLSSSSIEVHGDVSPLLGALLFDLKVYPEQSNHRRCTCRQWTYQLNNLSIFLGCPRPNRG